MYVPPAPYSGPFPHNLWFVNEIDQLKTLVREKAGATVLAETFPRFKWHQIKAKITALVEQGAFNRRGRWTCFAGPAGPVWACIARAST